MKKLLILLAVVALAGCYNDKYNELYPTGTDTTGNGGGGGGGTTCDTSNVTFAQTIKPIIDSKCATSGCHDAATLAGGYNFTVYGGVRAARNRMVGAITWASGYSQMPKGMNKLDDCSIAKITKWINDGAQNK
ncbi:MAG: hypothetical protein EOP51_09185 [Sphingobacteriales bacterium]|nr:MAG: hypothetical protein EOP51_09185 [Sphingobacteriales bacterium]